VKEKIEIEAPLSPDVIGKLRIGDSVRINGIIYTARDAAHKRIVAALEKGEKPPFDLEGGIIYYVGPTPARPGEAIGSAGPTTSCRMDAYAETLLSHGLKGMIGKGNRSAEVAEAIVRYGAVYFAAVGGAGALIARSIQESEIVAYEDLGPEAVRKLRVRGFPAVVANDSLGGDIFKEGYIKYRK